jgi:hypothetical protein
MNPPSSRRTVRTRPRPTGYPGPRPPSWHRALRLVRHNRRPLGGNRYLRETENRCGSPAGIAGSERSQRQVAPVSDRPPGSIDPLRGCDSSTYFQSDHGLHRRGPSILGRFCKVTESFPGDDWDSVQIRSDKRLRIKGPSLRKSCRKGVASWVGDTGFQAGRRSSCCPQSKSIHTLWSSRMMVRQPPDRLGCQFLGGLISFNRSSCPICLSRL